MCRKRTRKFVAREKSLVEMTPSKFIINTIINIVVVVVVVAVVAAVATPSPCHHMSLRYVYLHNLYEVIPGK